jgi:threonine dehydrogenase-like Zn-dependent dehydrogenase
MKVAVFERFGGPEVLELVVSPKPLPAEDEILIKVHATTVTAAECQMRRGRPLWGRLILGVVRPRRRRRTLGLELAGEVVSVGKNVRRFKPGDTVFGFTGFGSGANAEYSCMAQSGSVEIMPANVGFDDAAALVDGPSTALYFLRDKAHIRAGQKVLINGASGSIGTYAVQLARYFGAEVTAVCSARNADLVRALGADHVIDYGVDDFTRRRDLRRHLRRHRRKFVRAVPRRAQEWWLLCADDGISELASHVVDRTSSRQNGHHRDVRREAGATGVRQEARRERRARRRHRPALPLRPARRGAPIRRAGTQARQRDNLCRLDE